MVLTLPIIDIDRKTCVYLRTSFQLLVPLNPNFVFRIFFGWIDSRADLNPNSNWNLTMNNNLHNNSSKSQSNGIKKCHIVQCRSKRIL